MEVADLNGQFYQEDGPADYFFTRLVALMAVAGDTEEFVELMQRETEVGHAKFKLGPSGLGDDTVERYVQIESQVLLHHAAEALIRLFIAHRASSPCPWLDIAGEKNFATFKDRVNAEIVKATASTLAADVGFVFLGGRTAPAEDADRWTAACENLGAFLKRLASDWLEDANLYNSAKHGLTVVPGSYTFDLGDEAGGMVRLGQGASLGYLESGPWDKNSNTREWSLTTRWIDVSESIGLVHIACLMLGALWQLARVRYVDGDPPDKVFFPVDVDPRELRSPDSAPMQRMSWTVLIEHR